MASALPFTLGIIMLGLSAALFGTRVDKNGPRWAMAVSSACFVGGFLISALGLYLRQYWMVVVGYGFVGGIGLGIGYISPVSTLIKWFPDRPGLSTGIGDHGLRRRRAHRLAADQSGCSARSGVAGAPDVSGIAARPSWSWA